MKKLTIAAALAAATMLASPACAGDKEGKIQVKLLGTGVLPDGKITKVNSIAPSLAAMPVFATPQSFASDNVVPTLAVEYFFSPNISLETICCTTKHHVNGSGSLAGTNLVNDVLIVPATFTVKYHLPLGAIKPYVGAGPAVFLMLDSKPGATATALGVTRAKLSTEVGVAVQAGVDVPLGDSGFGITLDAKKYWIGTTAKFYAGTTSVLETEHKLDPWVLSGGVSYRF